SCVGVSPFGQMPVPIEGGTSVACTVSVNVCSTCGTLSCRACAFGSVHGFVGVGFAFDGQSYVAIPVTVVPGLNVRLISCGGGVNEAVTVCAEFIVSKQPSRPEQGLPQPANELLPLAETFRLTGVPAGYVAVQVPLCTPLVRMQSICWKLSFTVPLPVPMGATVSPYVSCAALTASVVLLSVAGENVPSPA